jgi:hypothetical protein
MRLRPSVAAESLGVSRMTVRQALGLERDAFCAASSAGRRTACGAEDAASSAAGIGGVSADAAPRRDSVEPISAGSSRPARAAAL